VHRQYCVVTEVHLFLSQLNTTNNCLTLPDARRRPRLRLAKYAKHTLGSVSCTPRALLSASVDLHVFRGPVYGKQDDLSIAIQDRMTLPAKRAQAADAGVVFAQLALIGCQKLRARAIQTTHTRHTRAYSVVRRRSFQDPKYRAFRIDDCAHASFESLPCTALILFFWCFQI